MNKVILIHCWEGYPEYCWYPYAKHELETRGFEVTIPFFPDALPLLDKWVNKLRQMIGGAGRKTLLVGHSLGCIAILKYLQALPGNEQIGGVVLVAPFVDNLKLRPLYSFFREPLNYEAIRRHCDRFIIIASSNDPYLRPYHAKVLQHQLNAEVIWKQAGHFTQSRIGGMCRELPEVVGAVEQMNSRLAETGSAEPAKKSNFVFQTH